MKQQLNVLKPINSYFKQGLQTYNKTSVRTTVLLSILIDFLVLCKGHLLRTRYAIQLSCNLHCSSQLKSIVSCETVATRVHASRGHLSEVLLFCNSQRNNFKLIADWNVTRKCFGDQSFFFSLCKLERKLTIKYCDFLFETIIVCFSVSHSFFFRLASSSSLPFI